jgi:hypothetical protein
MKRNEKHYESFLGEELANREGVQLLGPVWLLMRSASTVAESLAILEKHFSLYTDATALKLVNEFDGVSLCYEILEEYSLSNTGHRFFE